MTRTKQETRTIQTWPSGASYTYRGDPDGPANKRSLRTPARNSEPASRWRKGTAEEWRQIKINLRALIYQERDILCCDSSLVTDLLNAGSEGRGDLSEGFSWEEIRNLTADPNHWDAEQCRAWLDDKGIEYDECPGEPACKGADDPSEDCAEHGDSDEAIDTLRELVSDNASEHEAEVYEWWRVSSWLCDQLHAIGEVTIDNGYGHWWGRTCTGQGLIMDGTLQQIAARFD